MANLYDTDSRRRETVIRIPRFEIGEHYTVYTVEFALGPFKWSVNRRFSEFSNLHDELYNRHKLRDVDLPAKKIFGNQSYSFVQRRQKELEEYLCRLFQIYARPPPPLSRFTLWDKYEVHGITATMSAYVLGMGVASGTASGAGNGVPSLPPATSSSLPATPSAPAVSGSNAAPSPGQEWRRRLPFEFSVLQIHAINARIDSPAPTNDLDHMKYDVGHIMNFVTHLPAVRVWGSSGHFGTSNIIMNQLQYDLSIFKELEALELVRVDLSHMRGVDQLKRTLTKIVVHFTLQTLKELLLQDLLDCNLGHDSTMVQCWSRVKEADFADNSLRSIDESIKLLPNVQSLNLSGNQIPAITNLEHLSELQRLNLSRNGITDLINLNAKLGNIKELILVENRLTSLLGLSRVYSLQSLDVSKNQISEIIEVCHIGRLPCLENLRLSDNPVVLIPDYRTKVFEQFGERSPELRLDGRRGTQKELDTAAVLQALQRAKDHQSNSAEVRPSPAVSAVRSRLPGSPVGHLSPHQRPSPLPQTPPIASSGPEAQTRRDMAALKSRVGKQWLVEYNQMLDNQERERRQEMEAEAPEVQNTTLVTVPATEPAEEASESVADWADGATSTEASSSAATATTSASAASSATATTAATDATDAIAASDRLEARVEQALASLLHQHSPPPLAGHAPALCLLSEAAEGEVPQGGVVAVTQDGRLLLLSHHSDAHARWRQRVPFHDSTLFALQLVWEAPNLAQVVRGYRGLYLRLEERFASGPDGVVVILTMSERLTDRLTDAISAQSGLSVVNVDRVRQRQLEEYLRRAEDEEDPEKALMRFYGVALFQAGLLRQLVSVVVSRRRLYLLDEKFAALPVPVFTQQQQQRTGSVGAATFASLGVYSRRHLRLEEEAGGREEERQEEVLPEDDFFRYPATVRLTSEARGSLQELGFGFQSSSCRADFMAALAALQESPSTPEKVVEKTEMSSAAPAGRQLAFERWDALSVAVKHRVASAPDGGGAGSLRRLLDMDSTQLAAFFSQHVRQQAGEELVAVLWTYWLHYRSRQQEALACVFLTDRCIYVVFADCAEQQTLAFKSLTKRPDSDSSTEADVWAVRVYAFPIERLRTAYVGPFNHYVRLCGDGRDHDLTLITRDFRLTENLLNYLRTLFRGDQKPVDAAVTGQEEEEELVYRPSHRPASVERLSASGDADAPEIRFPNDEVLSEMMYVVEEAVTALSDGRGPGGKDTLSSSPHGALLDSLTLLYYLLLEHLSIDFVEYVTCSSADHLMAVLILTDDYLVILHQNISQYPIPDYECGPPELAQFSVLDVRRLRCLTHLTLNSCDRRLLVLSFAPNAFNPATTIAGTPSSMAGSLTMSHSADELGSVVPASPGLAISESTSMTDFSSSVPTTRAAPGAIYRPSSTLSAPGDPVHISAFIQNPRDVDKLVKLIRSAWKEHYPGLDLPVHRS